MTDYTASDASREYMPSSQRTSNWVYHHASRSNAQFYSPSMPPSPTDDSDAMSYTPSESDTDSTRSVPPRMIVRYPDGRDVIISEEYHNNDTRRSAQHAVPMSRMPSRHTDAAPLSHTSRSNSRSGSNISPRNVSNSSFHYPDYAAPTSASDFQSGQQRQFIPPQPSAYMTSVPSRIIPRPHTVQPSLRAQEEIRVLPPSNHTAIGATQVTTSYSHPSTLIRKTPPPGSIAYSQSHPPSKRDMRNASAYANMHYQHQQAAQNGLPNRYPHTSAVHYSSSGGHHPVTYAASNQNRHRPRTHSGPGWSVTEEDEAWRKPRSSYRDHSVSRHRDHSSSLSSDPPSLDYSGSSPTSRSQSTYYVAASPKQKVRLLEPEKSGFFSSKNPITAHYNSSSQWTTARASSPGFFTRLFRRGSIKKPSAGSVSGRNMNLSRRHSIGGGLRRI